MNPDLLTNAERQLRHLCGAIELSDRHHAKTGEHLAIDTSEARVVADALRTTIAPKHFCASANCPGYPWKASESRHPCGSVAPMSYPDALARLHRIAGAYTGHSDPYIRAILPPVPMEWATPADLQQWREMVIALTSALFLTDEMGIPSAVWSYVRAVADTLS